MTAGNQDDSFMAMALEEARLAAAEGEVPVGAVVVSGGQVVARAHNLRETLQDPTAHAEVLALRRAAVVMKSWRLSRATLYVTLEPCIMCMGAALLARVDRIVFGAQDPKGGAAGSVVDLSDLPPLNHRVEVVGGVQAQACAEALSVFFARLRRTRASKGREQGGASAPASLLG